MIKQKGLTVDENVWTSAHLRCLGVRQAIPRLNASSSIRQSRRSFARRATGDRSWLRKVQAVLGPRLSFPHPHRLPAGFDGLQGAGRTTPGEGCDKSLAWWFTEEPWRPNKNPDAPKARDLMKMSNLPKECRMVLAAPSPESEMAATFKGKGGNADTSIASVIKSAGRNSARPDVAIGASAYLPADGAKIPLPEWRPEQ